MKKEYFSPEFDLTRINFESLLTDNRTSVGEVGERDGDESGLDE